MEQVTTVILSLGMFILPLNNMNRETQKILFCTPFIFVLHVTDAFFAAYVRLGYEDLFRHIYTLPSPSSNGLFPDRIKDISKDFVKIYNQAQKAENEDLDEICGMGYRKSLEFLIKDYLIYKNPDEEETIKNMTLSNCIANKVTNENVKLPASRCNWLSGDFVHYKKLYAEYGIEELKELIETTVYWISMELSIEKSSKIDRRK